MLYAIPYFELKYFYFLGYPVQSWAVFFWAGWAMMVIITLKETKRLKLDLPTAWIMLLLSFLLSEFFAKLLFVLSHIFLHHDLNNDVIIKLCTLGRVYFGGLLGILIASWISVKITHQAKRFFNYLDIVLIGHIGSMIFYRFGNLLWHDHMGRITSFALGMMYYGQIRHEISLYEIINASIIFLLVWLTRKKIKQPGTIALLILFWIALSRFFLDFLRSNDLPKSNFHFSFGLTLNQVIYLTIAGFLLPTVIHRIKSLFSKSS